MSGRCDMGGVIYVAMWNVTFGFDADAKEDLCRDGLTCAVTCSYTNSQWRSASIRPSAPRRWPNAAWTSPTRRVFAGRILTAVDDRQGYGEPRRLTYGWLGDVAVMLVWTERGDTRRIISMRRMHEEEIGHVGLDRP